MEDEIKYKIGIETNFHIQNFLSYNNISNDSFFWTESFEMGNPFFFSSKILNNLQSVQTIYNTATQIISIYEGIYKLLDREKQYRKYFTLRDLYDLNENRFISHSIETKIYKIDIDFSKIKGQNRPLNAIYILFEKIIKDEFLINLFFLLSNDVDYKMLYIIYDDMRHYLKSNNKNDFLSEFSTSLNRFSHTANNYEVLGFYARHGRSNNQPPSSPMSLNESMNLIFDIIVKLLKEEFEIELPTFWGLTYTDLSDYDLEDLFGK